VTASPLRVVRIIARLNVGGPARHTVILDDGLRGCGYETMIVHGSVEEHEASLEHLVHERGLPSLHVPSLGRRISPFDDLRAFAAIFRTLRRWRPDVIHTHTAKAGTLGRLAAALHSALLPRRQRPVVVHTFHGHVFSNYFGAAGNLLVRSTERALARLTDLVIAISPTQRMDLTERFAIAPPDRVRVVPLGLELGPLLTLRRGCRRVTDEMGVAPDAVTVGFVGRLVPVKDVATLIRAVGIAARSIPQLHLLIAGDGALRAALSACARDAGIADRTHFLGWCTDLGALDSAMDVFALTSLNEGTPVSLIEAMAAGVPAIATNVGGVPDVIEHGMNGLLVPPREPAAMARAIVETVSDRARADERAQTARGLVAARHDPARLVRDIDALYREPLRRKRGAVAAAPRHELHS
jgi:glycosyltransferase involved in cell wall biosynthesis